MSYGRKKRDVTYDVTIAKRDVTKVSNDLTRRDTERVFDIDLGQEILISSTPLSKEIYVETGTKVDSIKAGDERESVLAGRDSQAGKTV